MVRTSKAGDQDAELAIIVHSAMALVVVGHRAGSALLHRQARLGDSPAPTGASENSDIAIGAAAAARPTAKMPLLRAAAAATDF